MTEDLVPAVSARRRARAGLAVALGTCAALSVLGGHLTSPAVDDADFGVPLVFAAVLILYLLPFLAQGGHVELDGQRYLTAWTVSGWRTVDLHRLASVRRYRLADEYVDMLVLVDADGVRLMLDKERVDQAAKRALSEHPDDAVHVSRDARYRLGLFDPSTRLRLWWFACRFVLSFALLALCAAPPMLLAWAASAM